MKQPENRRGSGPGSASNNDRKNGRQVSDIAEIILIFAGSRLRLDVERGQSPEPNHNLVKLWHHDPRQADDRSFVTIKTIEAGIGRLVLYRLARSDIDVC